MKFLFVLVIAIPLIFVTCKKPQFRPVIPAKIDSTTVQSVKPDPQAVLVKEVDFVYFRSKAKVRFNDGSQDAKVTANIRMKNDSIIWVLVEVSIGFDAMRVKITQDSIFIVDRDKKVYRRYDFKTLSEQYKFSFDYQLFQSIILGDMPVARSETDQVASDDTYFLIRQKRESIQIDNYINKLTGKLERLQARDTVTKTMLNISYSNFINLESSLFPQKNQVSLQHSNKQGLYNIQLELDHENIKTGIEPLDFPFRIPKNYERK